MLRCDFGVMFDFGLSKMVSVTIFEAYVYHKDMWIPVPDSCL